MLLKTQGGQFNWEQNGYLKYLHTKYAFESNYQTLIADEGVPYDSSRPSIYKRCLLGNGSDTIDLSDGIVGTLTLKGWVKVSSWSYGDITTGLSGTTLTLQSSTYYKSIERYDDGVLVDTFMLEEGAGDRVYSPQGNRGTITSSDLAVLRTTQDDAPILEESGDIQGFSEYLYFDGVSNYWEFNTDIPIFNSNDDYIEFGIWDKFDTGTSVDQGRWIADTGGNRFFYLRESPVDFRFYESPTRWAANIGSNTTKLKSFRLTRRSNTHMGINAEDTEGITDAIFSLNSDTGEALFSDLDDARYFMGSPSYKDSGVVRYVDFNGTVYDKNNIPELSSGSNQLICIPAQAADPTKDLAGGNTEFQGRKNFPVSPQAVNGSMLALDPTLDTYVTLNSPITHAGDTTLTLEFLVTRFNTTGTNCTILGSTDDATSEIGISYVSGSTYQLYYTWDGSSSTSNRVISNLPSDFIFKITIEKNSALGTADTIDNLRINITDLQGNSVIDSGQWTTYIGAEWTDKLDLFYRNSGGTKEFDGGVVVVRAYNDSTLVHEWQYYGDESLNYYDRGNNNGTITSTNISTATVQQSIYDNRVLYGYNDSNGGVTEDTPASISNPDVDILGNVLSKPSIIGVYDGTQLTTPDFCSTDTFLYNNQHLARDNGTYKDRFLMPIPYGDIDQNLPAWTNRSDSTNTVGDYFKLDSEINLSGVAELEVMWLGYTPKGYVQTILGGSNSSDNVYHLAIDSSGLLGGANGWSSTAPSLPSDFIFKYVINYNTSLREVYIYDLDRTLLFSETGIASAQGYTGVNTLFTTLQNTTGTRRNPTGTFPYVKITIDGTVTNHWVYGGENAFVLQDIVGNNDGKLITANVANNYGTQNNYDIKLQGYNDYTETPDVNLDSSTFTPYSTTAQTAKMKELYHRYLVGDGAVIEENGTTLVVEKDVARQANRPFLWKRCILGDGDDTIDLSAGISGTLTLKGWTKVAGEWSYGDITTGLSGTTLTLQSSTHYKSIERYDDGVLVDTFVFEEGNGTTLYSNAGNEATITTADIDAVRVEQEDCPLLPTSGDVVGCSKSYHVFNSKGDSINLNYTALTTLGEYLEMKVFPTFSGVIHANGSLDYISIASGTNYVTVFDSNASPQSNTSSLAANLNEWNVIRITKAATGYDLTVNGVTENLPNISSFWMFQLGTSSLNCFEGFFEYVDAGANGYWAQANDWEDTVNNNDGVINVPKVNFPKNHITGNDVNGLALGYTGRKDFPLTPVDEPAYKGTTTDYGLINNIITLADTEAVEYGMLVTNYPTNADQGIVGDNTNNNRFIMFEAVAGRVLFKWSGDFIRFETGLDFTTIGSFFINVGFTKTNTTTITDCFVKVYDLDGTELHNSTVASTTVGSSNMNIGLVWASEIGGKRSQYESPYIWRKINGTLTHYWEYLGNNSLVIWERVASNHAAITTSDITANQATQSVYSSRLKDGWSEELYFDGTAKVEAASNTVQDETTGDFTLLAWVCLIDNSSDASVDDDQGLIAKISIGPNVNGYALYLGSGTVRAEFVSSSTRYTTPSMTYDLDDNLNKWHLCVARFDRDGNLSATVVQPDGTIETQTIDISSEDGNSITNTETFTLGNYFQFTDRDFFGFMAQAAKFSSLLTDSELTELHTQGKDYSFENNVGNYTSSADLTGHWIAPSEASDNWVDTQGNGDLTPTNVKKEIIPTSNGIVSLTKTPNSDILFNGGSNINLGTTHTINMWFKLTPNSENQSYLLYEAPNRYCIYIAINAFYFQPHQDGGSGGSNLSSLVTGIDWFDNTLKMITLTRSGDTCKLYLNGGYLGEVSTSLSNVDTEITGIGGGLSANRNVVGIMPNTAFWSDVKTDSEIATIYSNGVLNDESDSANIVAQFLQKGVDYVDTTGTYTPTLTDTTTEVLPFTPVYDVLGNTLTYQGQVVQQDLKVSLPEYKAHTTAFESNEDKFRDVNGVKDRLLTEISLNHSDIFSCFKNSGTDDFSMNSISLSNDNTVYKIEFLINDITASGKLMGNSANANRMVGFQGTDILHIQAGLGEYNVDCGLDLVNRTEPFIVSYEWRRLSTNTTELNIQVKDVQGNILFSDTGNSFTGAIGAVDTINSDGFSDYFDGTWSWGKLYKDGVLTNYWTYTGNNSLLLQDKVGGNHGTLTTANVADNQGEQNVYNPFVDGYFQDLTEYEYFNTTTSQVKLPFSKTSFNNGIIEMDVWVEGTRVIFIEGEGLAGGYNFIQAQDGSTASIGTGFTNIYVDGVELVSPNRQTLYDAINLSRWVSVKFTGVDLSSWNALVTDLILGHSTTTVRHEGAFRNLKFDLTGDLTNEAEYLGYGATPWSDTTGNTNDGIASGFTDTVQYLDKIVSQHPYNGTDVFGNTLTTKGYLQTEIDAGNVPASLTKYLSTDLDLFYQAITHAANGNGGTFTGTGDSAEGIITNVNALATLYGEAGYDFNYKADMTIQRNSTRELWLEITLGGLPMSVSLDNQVITITEATPSSATDTRFKLDSNFDTARVIKLDSSLSALDVSSRDLVFYFAAVDEKPLEATDTPSITDIKLYLYTDFLGTIVADLSNPTLDTLGDPLLNPKTTARKRAEKFTS